MSFRDQGTEWYIQDHKFVANLKVIPLPYYDIILGTDWLAKHSHVNIDWLKNG
jgi:hypothetical protein